VITSPKTPKSNRIIKIPKFLCEEIQEYINILYEIGADERLFQVTKHYLHHEMDRGAKAAGVKKIRIHDIRHSHISLLIEMGFTALAIAERVGHESIKITSMHTCFPPSKRKWRINWTLKEWRKKMDKNVDNKGRWRNITVGFRVSEEEGRLIDDCVRLSGLTKQDYITRRLLCRDVVVQGNPRVFKALRNRMAEIYVELKRIEKYGEISEEFLYTLQLVAETMNGLKGEDE